MLERQRSAHRIGELHRYWPTFGMAQDGSFSNFWPDSSCGNGSTCASPLQISISRGA